MTFEQFIADCMARRDDEGRFKDNDVDDMRTLARAVGILEAEKDWSYHQHMTTLEKREEDGND